MSLHCWYKCRPNLPVAFWAKQDSCEMCHLALVWSNILESSPWSRNASVYLLDGHLPTLQLSGISALRRAFAYQESTLTLSITRTTKGITSHIINLLHPARRCDLWILPENLLNEPGMYRLFLWERYSYL